MVLRALTCAALVNVYGAGDEGLIHASPTEDGQIFTALLKAAQTDPAKAADRINKLFSAMQKKGGIYGNDDIA